MPNAPAPSDDFEPWEIELITTVVRSFLATRPLSALLQAEDLTQEALLHWWHQRSRHASERGASRQTFLRRVVRAKLLDIEREFHAEKRGGFEGALSLDMPVGEGESLLGDMIAGERQPEALIRAFERVKEKLTDRQKRLVEALDEGRSKSEAAKRLGIHRDTLYQDLERIKAVFRDEGLEEFLY